MKKDGEQKFREIWQQKNSALFPKNAENSAENQTEIRENAPEIIREQNAGSEVHEKAADFRTIREKSMDGISRNSHSPAAAKSAEKTAEKAESTEENKSAWIANAVENRSEKAEKSIAAKRELLAAKKVDPRAEISRKNVKKSEENSRKNADEKPNFSRKNDAKTPDAKFEKLPIEQPNPKVAKKRSWVSDVVEIAILVVLVIVGSWLINQFVIRSFNVTGPSMYPTLDGNDAGEYTTAAAGETSDRLIVNMIPVTIDHLQSKTYVPQRGQIIVFRNPQYVPGSPDEFVVKRVIGLPGETVKIANGVLKIYNEENPNGFNPYKSGSLFDSVANPDDTVAGDGTDVQVPQGTIFVVGDHRDDNGMQWSMDSRNDGKRATLGNIPLENIIGPVSVRMWPLNKIEFF